MPEVVSCPTCERSMGSDWEQCPRCGRKAELAPEAAAAARLLASQAWEKRRTRLERYQSAIGLGTFLQLMLGIATLASVHAVWLDVAYRNALTGLVDGTVSIDDAIAIEDQWGLSGMIEFFMYVTIGVVWIIWMWRMYRNVEPLGRERSHSIHWCLWGWVIPIGSLWIPRMVTGDIWMKSDPDFSNALFEKAPWIINLWWGLFLVSVVVGRGLGFSEPEDLDGWIDLASTYVWVDSFGVALAVVSILMVRSLTNRQSAAHQAVQAELRSTMPM